MAWYLTGSNYYPLLKRKELIIIDGGVILKQYNDSSSPSGWVIKIGGDTTV